MGFFPPDYKKASGAEETSSGPNPKYFEFSKKYLGPGETASYRICGDFDSGHVVCGFQYFTNEGRIRRFPNYPENYQSDIGLTYQAKKDGTEEKDKPKYFLSFTAFSPEKDDFICVTVLQKGLREQIEEILAMEDYTVNDGPANFIIQVKRKGEGLDTRWVVTPTLKKASAAFTKKWDEAKASIWLPALYVGADPFAGKPAEAKLDGLPPMKRDELGADTEVATAGISNDW